LIDCIWDEGSPTKCTTKKYNKKGGESNKKKNPKLCDGKAVAEKTKEAKEGGSAVKLDRIRARWKGGRGQGGVFLSR